MAAATGRDVNPEPAHDSPDTPPHINRDIRCARCAYSLVGLPYDAPCPECATPVSDSIRAHHVEHADASLALLFGALSIITPVLGLLFSGAAFIFFARARRAMECAPAPGHERSVAVAGAVLGAVGVLVSIFAMLMLLSAIV